MASSPDAVANTSCIPNIRNSFDAASFSLQIYAWTRIKKGDELVWSYVSDVDGAAQRQKRLSPYGFKCKCRICVDPKADALWTSFTSRSYIVPGFLMIQLLKQDLDDPLHKKSAAGKEARLRDYNTMIARLESLQRESDSYGFIGELRLLCLLHELYKRVGNDTKRRRYANLVIRWTRCKDIDSRPYL